ncbi:MAG TPA: DUF3277 domain-containing protein [Deltaproteobacteria bacterium]|nr:DUF3277 domain-containing protein [Deltaproteobacteria bacterium]
MSAKTYDPKQIVLIVGGFQLSGYADGTFVNVDRNEDMYTLQIGADGEGVRSKSNNRSGTVTFSLLQSSASNEILSAFAKADELSNSGVFPLLIKDTSGTSIYAAEMAWIKKIASSEFGNEAGAREWAIETDRLEAFVGKHN